MDALAGYGSDDSSANSEEAQQATESAQKSALEKLMPSDSDASDSSAAKDDTAGGTASVKMTTKYPATKKLRVESNTSFPMPEPILARDDNDSWILWQTNYLRLPQPQPLQLENPPSTLQIQENLQRLARNIGNEIPSWADHLRAQQEFHNPHFFASVVEHFGIETPLASFLDDTTVKEYEREMIPLVTSANDGT